MCSRQRLSPLDCQPVAATIPRPMATDSRSPPRNVIDDVRAACSDSGRPTTEAEVIRALDALRPDELAKVHRLARSPLNARLGPDALVDVARGTPTDVAAARELAGYYRLRDERDALATVARNLSRARESAPPASPSLSPTDSSGPEDSRSSDNANSMNSESEFQDSGHRQSTPSFSVSPELDEVSLSQQSRSEAPKKRSRSRKAANTEETQELLTLFAYHRDPVRVAQELGLSASQLQERVDELGLRSRVTTILERTTDIDLFQPQRFTPRKSRVSPTPLIRKRGEKPEPKRETAAEPEPEPTPEQPNIVWEPREKLDRHEAEVKKGRGKHAATKLSPRREYVRPTPTKKTARRPAKAPRKKQKAAPVAPPPELKLSLTSLFTPEARPMLEELLETEKANVRMLAAKLSENYEGPGGRDLNEEDLRSLFDHHGLTEEFNQKELANTRFLMGFHQGARGKLANALLMSLPELESFLARLGLTAELERLREQRAKQELGRNRLRDRFMQVLTRAPYLDDLGILPVIDREVEETLREFFNTRQSEATSPEELEELVREDTGLEKNQFAKLLKRYDMQEHARDLKPGWHSSSDPTSDGDDDDGIGESDSEDELESDEDFEDRYSSESDSDWEDDSESDPDEHKTESELDGEPGFDEDYEDEPFSEDE